tara:strand:+ start:25 stop:384 length:360 start_codon:yes stop_codon:yes gene_type:complete
MKKLLLLLTLTSTLLSSAQIDDMEGSWVSETSSYITTIITNDSTAVKIYNTSFKEDRVIDEKIVNKDSNSFTTKLYNEENGYKVYIRYVLKDSNTILCYFSGDLNKTITIKKLSYFWIN